MGKMNSCENGHWYDNDLYSSCPYCGNAVSGAKKTEVASDDDIKTSLWAGVANPTAKTEKYEDEPATRMYIPNSMAVENVLMAGWLVTISTVNRAKYYPILFGINTIGRDNSNTISINSDDSISRAKNSIIIYDYENNIFFLRHGDGKFLTYLNGQVVYDNKEMKAYDKIKIGKTELIFVPLCNENFKWEL
jgi:hypothetical protein